jgi:hypothetical protein
VRKLFSLAKGGLKVETFFVVEAHPVLATENNPTVENDDSRSR